MRSGSLLQSFCSNILITAGFFVIGQFRQYVCTLRRWCRFVKSCIWGPVPYLISCRGYDAASPDTHPSGHSAHRRFFKRYALYKSTFYLLTYQHWMVSTLMAQRRYPTVVEVKVVVPIFFLVCCVSCWYWLFGSRLYHDRNTVFTLVYCHSQTDVLHWHTGLRPCFTYN